MSEPNIVNENEIFQVFATPMTWVEDKDLVLYKLFHKETKRQVGDCIQREASWIPNLPEVVKGVREQLKEEEEDVAEAVRWMDVQLQSAQRSLLEARMDLATLDDLD